MDRALPSDVTISLRPSNVIPISVARRRRAAAALYEPCPDTIDLLERILARARTGEIVAVAIATVYHDRATGTGYRRGRTDTGNDLTAAVSNLHHRVNEEI
jgi:hypothetical protein